LYVVTLFCPIADFHIPAISRQRNQGLQSKQPSFSGMAIYLRPQVYLLTWIPALGLGEGLPIAAMAAWHSHTMQQQT
jgi:hypothetical protein